MLDGSMDWTLQFAQSQLHDGIERLVDQVTPGNSQRLAADPGAFDELLAVHNMAITVAEQLLRETVTAARGAGRTWTQIGEALGLSRQEAQARFTGSGAGDGTGYDDGAQMPNQYAHPGVLGQWPPTPPVEFGRGMFGSRKRGTWVPTMMPYLAVGENILFITSTSAEMLSDDSYRIMTITDQRVIVIGDNKGLTFAINRNEVLDFKFSVMDFLTFTTPIGPMKAGNVDTKDIPIINRVLGR